jgi:putative flippase GtrA
VNAGDERSLFLRWLKFNFVGLLGVGVQLGTLSLLVTGFEVKYLHATAAAVELAVVHNFLWHEYFTWRERTHRNHAGFLHRLFSFHASNGFVSLVSNMLLMKLFVGIARTPYLIANLLAILVCSIANFLLAELVVFIAMSKRPSEH